MALSFGNIGNSLGSGSQAAATGAITQGPDLEIISTEALGFLTLAGDAKLQLTSQWSPAPSRHASLLSIASRKGLVAAAGPDALIVDTTEAVRKAFGDGKAGDNDVRPFEPKIKIPLPQRICQLAFTADENFLIMSAEQGGGLAVYDVQSLLQGSRDTAFSIATNNESLRALATNPMPEMGELCAVVTDKGNLLIANMKEQNFVSGPNGQILQSQVSCVAWSKKGKQLIAGLGDGTIQQMTPKGEVKAQIPKPAGLDSNYFVSFLVWLENDVFLAIHVSTAETPPSSQYHLITRQGKNFTSQKLNDPVDPFGSDKVPHHTAARLKDFPPNLQDLLIFSSTATPDIGLITRSKAPLSSECPAEKITNVFTTTELADDSRRATLPMGMGDGAPVGTALDLSSKARVLRPIPTDEMDYSPGPLPGYWVLNDEGVLSVWWIVYSASIREGTTYSELSTASGPESSGTTMETSTPVQPSPFGASTPSAFGQPAATPSAFGQPAAAPSAFGATSTLGSKPSVWGSQTTTGSSSGGGAFGSASSGSSLFGSGPAASATKFGQPSFGTPAFSQASHPNQGNAPAFGQSSGVGAQASPWATSQGSAPAFGQSSGIGARSSPWASASASTAAPAFGQSGFPSAAKGPSPFSNTGTPGSNATGGFASFATSGGFASLAPKDGNNSTNIFSSTPQTKDVSMGTDNSSSFPPASKLGTNTNAFGSTPFKLTSSFQPDSNARDDDSVVGDSNGGTMSTFSSGLAAAMGDSLQGGLIEKKPDAQSTTPTTTPAPPKFLSQTSAAPPSGGIFGLPKNTVLFGSSSATGSQANPKIQIEASTPLPSSKDVANAPLPPESTSKATFPFGESSSSSETSSDFPDTTKAPSDTPLPSSVLSPGKESDDTPDSPSGVDAPLPPDPTTNKKLYEVDYKPPGTVSQSKPAPKPVDDPLPPDPTMNKKLYNIKYEVKLGELSQPKLGPSQVAEKPAPFTAKSVFETALPKAPGGFLFPSNPPPVSDSEEDEDEDEVEDEDEERDESEEGGSEGSEGSGVDVAKDLSPPSAEKGKTPGFTPQSSFDGGLGGSFSTISQPDNQRGGLFGELGRGVPMFAQPNPISPRSPSPVRGSTRLPAVDNMRSFSAPGMASHILGASKRPQSRLGMGTGAPIIGKEVPTNDPQIEQQRKARARKEAEESQVLVDEEDELKQELLGAPIKPTLQLDEFIAHTGPMAPAGDNIPAQVEAVYRDINAMIDTLGINARSLTNFIEGHERVFSHGNLERPDLDDPNQWTLGDLKSLSRIVGLELPQELEGARVKDIEEKLSHCRDLQRETARDRSKRDDLQKLIHERLGIENELANKTLPLSTEQAAQQAELRRELGRVLKLLAKTEEDLSMLRAKIANVGAAIGKGTQPTIEAVMRTIAKMTSMAEKRSGDVDVLENQMRKVRFSSPGLGASIRSREGSPFSTPMSKLGASRMFSPERSSTPGQRYNGSVIHHSMSASVASIGGGMFAVGTPPRKKITNFSEMEMKAIKERKDRRRAVLDKLRISVENRGPIVQSLDPA